MAKTDPWISVEKEWPDLEDGTVLVYLQTPEKVTFSRFIDGLGFSGVIQSDVTHWRYLPPPPQTDEDDE